MTRGTCETRNEQANGTRADIAKLAGAAGPRPHPGPRSFS
jgi:hypothetical protein